MASLHFVIFFFCVQRIFVLKSFVAWVQVWEASKKLNGQFFWHSIPFSCCAFWTKEMAVKRKPLKSKAWIFFSITELRSYFLLEIVANFHLWQLSMGQSYIKLSTNDLWQKWNFIRDTQMFSISIFKTFGKGCQWLGPEQMAPVIFKLHLFCTPLTNS